MEKTIQISELSFDVHYDIIDNEIEITDVYLYFYGIFKNVNVFSSVECIDKLIKEKIIEYYEEK